MWRRKTEISPINLTRVWRTNERPGSKGTYIVRLSKNDRERLKAKDGDYLKVSYGAASVLACLSEDSNLPDRTIRIDQTLRTAICLKKVMQSSDEDDEKELVYNREGEGGGYVNRCVNDIRRRPSQPLIQWRFHPHTVHRDRRLRSTQGPSDA